MRSAQLLDNLNDAVRENPVAAGLIGLGIAWMFFGGSVTAARRASAVAHTAKAAIDTSIDAATETVSGAIDQTREAAAAVSATISETMQTGGSMITDAVEDKLNLTGDKSHMKSEFDRHFPSLSSNSFSDLLNRRPLVLAAVGLAVGAAIAAAFPTTDAESRVIGTTGEKLREKLSDATISAVDKAGSVIEEVTDEAVAQSLTPDALKDVAKSGAAKLKNVAKAGLEALEK